VAHLEGYSARGRQVFPLEGERITLGRSAEADVHLEGDDKVSRLHAVLERLDGGWRISDLGSRNGTFVNELRMHEPVALRPGDALRLGGWRLTFVDATHDADGTMLDGDSTDRPLPSAPPGVELSRRERDVLALLARGDTDEQIAGALFISVATVRSHLDRIRDKTGCRRRPELTRFAVEQGIVPPAREAR
jgi:DNA-binding CsgD family transcriptional regulator